jgi:hypothetical protein
MKRHGIARGQRPGRWIIALLSLLLILLPAGCADEPSGNSQARSSGSGSAAMTIHWHATPEVQDSAIQAESLDCAESGIDTVVVQVYDDDGNLLVTSDAFACEAGHGTVTDIPAGANRTFVMLAEDGDGYGVYQGVTTGITITPGQITEGVVVEAFPFVPVLIAPDDEAVVDMDNISLQWQTLTMANEYLVEVALDEAFEQVVVNGVVDAEAGDPMTYTPQNLEPSTRYYWRIHSLDSYLNQSAESEIRSFTTSECDFEISEASREFDPEGGPGSFDVSASAGDCQWSATVDADWIQITAGASGTGNGTVSYTVTANSDTSQRTGTITAGGQSHTIIQQGTTCTYAISSPENSFGPQSGTGSFDVSASPGDCQWNASVDADWIQITAGATGTGDGSVSYTVLANAGDSRSAVIIAAGLNHTVSQEAGTCTYSITPTHRDVSAAGEIYGVAVTASHNQCSWTTFIPPSSRSWITLSAAGGTGSGDVTISVASNDGAARSATITIAGESHTISQAAVACSYTISPNTREVSAQGESYVVAVTASNAACSWTTAVPANRSWVTLSPTSGTGSGSVTVTVAANNGAARTARITIAGRTHTITQAAGACSYSISPPSRDVPAAGESYDVAVTASRAACSWNTSVPANASSWITVSPTSGSGSGSVTVTVAANSGAARSAQITIAGQTHTVSQASGACSYSISPASRNVSAAGDSYPVTVTASHAECSWTTSVPANASSWITVSPTSGSGTRNVTVSVDANSGAARDATITIAGETHTIHQAGVTVTNHPWEFHFRFESQTYDYAVVTVSIPESSGGSFSATGSGQDYRDPPVALELDIQGSYNSSTGHLTATIEMQAADSACTIVDQLSTYILPPNDTGWVDMTRTEPCLTTGQPLARLIRQ